MEKQRQFKGNKQQRKRGQRQKRVNCGQGKKVGGRPGALFEADKLFCARKEIARNEKLHKK